MINLNRKVNIKIPTRPRNITIEDVSLDISNFDKEELTKIGLAWTEKLIEEAEEKRKEYNKQ